MANITKEVTIKSEQTKKEKELNLSFKDVNINEPVIGEHPTSSTLDASLTITTNEGRNLNLGVIKGLVGETGNLILNAVVNVSNELVITDSLSNQYNVGNITGLTGNKGLSGDYITSVYVNGSNELIFVLNTTAEINAGSINAKIIEVGDVIPTLNTVLDSNPDFIKLDVDHSLDATTYSELYTVTGASTDPFTIEKLINYNMMYYMKAK